MRSLKLLPLSVLLAAVFPAAAQEAPRVLFCAGECFAVDGKGLRTPAPKGTTLAPGQRLETGPGGYAQVKLGRDAAVGIGEQAKVRFERSAVVLDEGRLRMVGGPAFGKPDARAMELRTGDGTLVLRNADVEVKKSSIPGTASAPTLVQLNAGDASLRNGRSELALPKHGVQTIAAGKMLPAGTTPVTALAPVTRPQAASRQASAPVKVAMSNGRDPIVLPMPPVTVPPLTKADQLLVAPVLDTRTGTTTTLTTVLQEPTLSTTTSTTTTTTKTLTTATSTTLTSPTLSTTTLLLR